MKINFKQTLSNSNYRDAFLIFSLETLYNTCYPENAGKFSLKISGNCVTPLKRDLARGVILVDFKKKRRSSGIKHACRSSLAESRSKKLNKML